MRPKAIKVEPLKDYILLIEFDNKEIKYFDVKPYLKYKAFETIKDENNFKKVRISGLSIQWDNGPDICPDELYNNSFSQQ